MQAPRAGARRHKRPGRRRRGVARIPHKLPASGCMRSQAAPAAQVACGPPGQAASGRLPGARLLVLRRTGSRLRAGS